MPDDPLDDIYRLPVNEQLPVLISVLRTTRNSQARIERKVDWLQRSFVALIVSLLLVAITVKFGAAAPSPAGNQAPPAGAVTP